MQYPGLSQHLSREQATDSPCLQGVLGMTVGQAEKQWLW